MSFSFKQFMADIAAKPEDGNAARDELITSDLQYGEDAASSSTDFDPLGAAKTAVPSLKCKEDGNDNSKANEEVTNFADLLLTADGNGEPPAATQSSRAEDFIAAALANVNLKSEAGPALAVSGAAESEKIVGVKISEENPNSLAPGMSEAEYVFKALSRVPPDMRYQMIPSLVKNLTLKTYGDVRVSGCISSPIMSVRCQPYSTPANPVADIEQTAAQILEATTDSNAQPATSIEGLVNTVLSLTQTIREIEDISTIPTSNEEGSPDVSSVLTTMPSNGDNESKNHVLAEDIMDAVSSKVDQIISLEDEKPKVWREGMDNKEDASKTVFMTQNLNRQYEQEDSRDLHTSYVAASAKIVREVGYFSKILHRVGGDLRDTEYSVDPIRVLDVRQKIKDSLVKLKGQIDEFISTNLEGDIREKPEEKMKKESAEKVKVDYVYPPEKKPQGKEQKIAATGEPNQSHICTDCRAEIVVAGGASLEEALQNHSHGDESAAAAVAVVPDKEKAAKEPEKKDKKANEAKYKRAMFLNKVVPNLIDDNLVSCVPCGFNFESDNATVTNHMDSESHVQKLNQFNLRAQRDIMLCNPDIFGPQKLFTLTDLHIVMNKIFVDPLSKYAYCGLCRKELPPRQQNIEEHIKSKWHDKLLLDTLEGKLPTLSNGRGAASGGEVKTAQMLDVAEQQQLDISELEKILDTKAQRRSVPHESSQEDGDNASNSSHGSDSKNNGCTFCTSDGKYICLLCDTRGITSQYSLSDHLNGSIHKSNVEASRNLRSGLRPDQQALMVQNLVAVSYGKHPLIFECFACGSAAYANLTTALDHVHCVPHVKNLAKAKNKQQNPRKIIEKKLNPRVAVILHRNGAEYWCFNCRVTLPNVSAAFEHAKSPGHASASVDGVEFTSGTQFYCNYCAVKINGERNVGQHIVGPKHKSFASTANTSRPRSGSLQKQGAKPSDSVAAPSFSRAQLKKMKEEAKSEPTPDPVVSSEALLLQKNGVFEVDRGMYQCAFCNTPPKPRSEIFLHIFSFEHVGVMAKLGSGRL